MLEVESALYASLLNAVFHHCLSKNESGDVGSKHPKRADPFESKLPRSRITDGSGLAQVCIAYMHLVLT